jgi:hypothetical protein
VPRRRVIVLETFFDNLEAVLPSERGADGTPSITDFIQFDLMGVIDVLAEDYEGSTIEIDDLPGYRTLIISGSTVSYLAVYVRLAAGDIVEVIDFEIDTGTDQPDN